jgi:hypothetical protein
MNERIRQLREQAWTLVSNEERDRGELYEAREQWERCDQKFAELIVRECTSKCEFVANMATITNTGEMARKTKATADSCATMIKQHFGVEE